MAEPNEYWRAFFPLVCMMGPRKSELLAAKWADVDLEQRTWSIPETKAGRTHLLPLPAQAVAIVEKLPSRGKSEWLFPGVGKTGAFRRKQNPHGAEFVMPPKFLMYVSTISAERSAHGWRAPGMACH